jgi:hypothetical protein
MTVFGMNSGSLFKPNEHLGTYFDFDFDFDFVRWGRIWWQFNTCSDYLSKCSEVAEMKFPSCQQLVICMFLRPLPSVDPIFICFAHQRVSSLSKKLLSTF